MVIPETRYLLAIVIVIVLILAFLAYRGKLKETVKARPKKRTRSKQRTPKAGRTRRTPASNETGDDADADDENVDDDTAQELYNLVHDRMVGGMQSDEFLDIVGDMADNFTYVEIKQLYNNAKNRGTDPQDVSVDAYAKLLDKDEE
jgi:hypothetical protein